MYNFWCNWKYWKSTFQFFRQNKSKLKNVEGITCNTNCKNLVKIAKLYNVKKIGFNEKSIKKK